MKINLNVSKTLMGSRRWINTDNNWDLVANLKDASVTVGGLSSTLTRIN